MNEKGEGSSEEEKEEEEEEEEEEGRTLTLYHSSKHQQHESSMYRYTIGVSPTSQMSTPTSYGIKKEHQ